MAKSAISWRYQRSNSFDFGILATFVTTMSAEQLEIVASKFKAVNGDGVHKGRAFADINSPFQVQLQ